MASSAKDIQLRELKDTVSQLKTMMSEQTEMIRSLRLIVEEKTARIVEEKTAREQSLQEEVEYLKKKLFGASSERKTLDIPGQLNLFDEAEQEQDLSRLDEEEETVVKEHVRKKKSTHADTFKGIKVNKIVIPLSDEEKTCPECGTQMELIGTEYVRRESLYLYLLNARSTSTIQRVTDALSANREQTIQGSRSS